VKSSLADTLVYKPTAFAVTKNSA